MSRNVDVILVKDFTNSLDVLLWQSFLFWNQISYFNGHVYSSLIVEMKSEKCQFLKVFLKIKFLRSKIQHTLFKICNPLIVLYFKNRNWPIVRLKWLFPWFFVSILNSNFGYIVCDEVTFYEFQEKQGTRVKTWGFIKKDCFFFLATILSACIIISSLIHEVTTCTKQLFKFWDRHLSVQIAYLIKKDFLKHVM